MGGICASARCGRPCETHPVAKLVQERSGTLALSLSGGGASSLGAGPSSPSISMPWHGRSATSRIALHSTFSARILAFVAVGTLLHGSANASPARWAGTLNRERTPCPVQRPEPQQPDERLVLLWVALALAHRVRLDGLRELHHHALPLLERGAPRRRGRRCVQERQDERVRLRRRELGGRRVGRKLTRVSILHHA